MPLVSRTTLCSCLLILSTCCLAYLMNKELLLLNLPSTTVMIKLPLLHVYWNPSKLPSLVTILNSTTNIFCNLTARHWVHAILVHMLIWPLNPWTTVFVLLKEDVSLSFILTKNIGMMFLGYGWVMLRAGGSVLKSWNVCLFSTVVVLDNFPKSILVHGY